MGGVTSRTGSEDSGQSEPRRWPNRERALTVKESESPETPNLVGFRDEFYDRNQGERKGGGKGGGAGGRASELGELIVTRSVFVVHDDPTINLYLNIALHRCNP